MTPFWRFAYRLALALGYPFPGHLMRIMPGRTLDGWIAFDRVEPIGEPHADTRSAMLATVMANLWGRGKDDDPFTMDQFMLAFGDEAQPTKKAATPDELASKVMMLNQLYGGTFVDKRKKGENGD